MVQVFPKLRPLDIRPYQQDGQQYLLLRDPLQITEHSLLIPQIMAPLLVLCDGTQDAVQLAANFSQHLGLLVTTQLVEELIQRLDDGLMLDNVRYQAKRTKTLNTYRCQPFRKPALAGQSYPATANALWRFLQDYLEDANSIEPLAVDWSHPLGILSPHIDYLRGGTTYAKIWKRMAHAAREADLAIIFGTDHYGIDPFTLTQQNYATPYGTLPTARPIVDALAESIGTEAAYAGELRHQGEHSLELVATWLHHMRAGDPCELVPILCGGFHRFLSNGAQPNEDQEIQQVIKILRQMTAGRRVLVIASGDLAHVGPAFGGAPIIGRKRTQLRQTDDEMIANMVAGDADGFFAAIRRINDQNNVCGVAPIYLTMQMVGAIAGEAVDYAACPADDYDTSVVTISGMVFHAQSKD